MSSDTVYRLYKYRSLSPGVLEYTRRIVRDGFIYYAAPEQFNDPFDCRWCFSGDEELPPEIRHADPTRVRKHADDYMWSVVNQNFCVFSLAGVNDDLLMWSHYADSHRGICLELTFRVDDPPHKVIYSDLRPRIPVSDIWPKFQDRERWEGFVVDVLKTKSPSWSYEKEHRLIGLGQRGERKFPRTSLTGIIFGCETSDGDKQIVRDWVNTAALTVRFMQASRRDYEYAIDVIPME